MDHPQIGIGRAALLARLLNHVTCNLRGTINLDETVYAWTDSRIVLCWLQTSVHTLEVFVANRVSQITGSETPLVWRHVPGEWNPADCASRGCRAPDLVSHPLWWGPQWLTESPQEWPFNECRAPLGPPDRGLRVNVGQLVPKPNPAFLLERFAILSNGAENMVMSPQSLLSCNVKGQRGCDGGHIDAAWLFATKYGLVDADCFPYVAKVTRCPYRRSDDLKTAGCRPKIQSRTLKYRMSPPYKIDQEKDIQYELMESGPVQAIMHVYQDFFHYKDGIYRHTKYGNQHEMGLHSVKIIGWGEERGDRYWIVANSWGSDWGENGYFRIARGDNESNIESFVIASLSDVNEANQRK
ncbi:papain family cysteine protease domain-containing protein [Phthorimaea operculella]|nr:papain family cysteine protease domain-containing protein [Phthorimaea operculella]